MVSGVRPRAQSQSAHRGTALLSFGPVRPRAKPKRWGADNTAWFPAFVPAHKAKAQHLPHFLRSHTPFVPARSQSGLLTTRCSEGTFIPAREAMPRKSRDRARPARPFIPAREAMPNLGWPETEPFAVHPRARGNAGVHTASPPHRRCFHPRARGNAPLQAGATHKKAPPPTARARLQKWSGMASVTVPSAAACAVAGLLRAGAGFVPSFPLPNSCR